MAKRDLEHAMTHFAKLHTQINKRKEQQIMNTHRIVTILTATPRGRTHAWSGIGLYWQRPNSLDMLCGEESDGWPVNRLMQTA
jgi:alanine racemase